MQLVAFLWKGQAIELDCDLRSDTCPSRSTGETTHPTTSLCDAAVSSSLPAGTCMWEKASSSCSFWTKVTGTALFIYLFIFPWVIKEKGTGYGASAIVSGKHIISSACLAVCLLGKVIFLLTAALSWLSVWGYLYTSRMEFATESLMYFPALPLLPWLHFLHARSIKHPWHPVLTLVAGGDCWQICIFCIYSFPEALLLFFSLFWGIIDFNKLLAG